MAILRALRPFAKVGYPHEVHISARAEIGATGAVGDVHGRYVTFARTGVGVYTATISNSGGLLDLLYAECEVLNTTQLLMARVAFVLATGVFTITVETTGGTDTEITDGGSLCFRAIVVNANVAS